MIESIVYLKFNHSPTRCNMVLCNNCKKTLNAGPNYQPKFCDMCGTPISDNLNEVDWKKEEVEFVDYVNYLLDTLPDYVIMKVKYEHTDWGRAGLPISAEHIPVMIGKNMEDLLEFVNEHSSRHYIEDDFEPATKNELIEYAKTCGRYWND